MVNFSNNSTETPIPIFLGIVIEPSASVSLQMVSDIASKLLYFARNNSFLEFNFASFPKTAPILNLYEFFVESFLDFIDFENKNPKSY